MNAETEDALWCWFAASAHKKGPKSLFLRLGVQPGQNFRFKRKATKLEKSSFLCVAFHSLRAHLVELELLPGEGRMGHK